jgi:uncharacterized protein (TIGR00369 family)
VPKNHVYLPTYKGCVVCGQPQVNPSTLNRRFKVTPQGVEVEFTSNFKQEGYRGVVHGGIMCSLLDETIGWAVAVDRKKYFMTGELNVRFVRPWPIGVTMVIKGWSVEHKSKYTIAKGEIVDKKGAVYAKASGKFFLMSDEQAQKVHRYLTFQEGDMDILNDFH